MTDIEASKVIYFSQAALRDPSGISEFMSIVLRDTSTLDFKQVLICIESMVRDSLPFDSGFRQRITDRSRQAGRQLSREDNLERFAINTILGTI